MVRPIVFGFMGASQGVILAWGELTRTTNKKTTFMWFRVVIGYLLIFALTGWLTKGTVGGVSFGLAGAAVATVMACRDRYRTGGID
jgi:hypothetical protein